MDLSKPRVDPGPRGNQVMSPSADLQSFWQDPCLAIATQRAIKIKDAQSRSIGQKGKRSAGMMHMDSFGQGTTSSASTCVDRGTVSAVCSSFQSQGGQRLKQKLLMQVNKKRAMQHEKSQQSKQAPSHNVSDGPGSMMHGATSPFLPGWGPVSKDALYRQGTGSSPAPLPSPAGQPGQDQPAYQTQGPHPDTYQRMAQWPMSTGNHGTSLPPSSAADLHKTMMISAMNNLPMENKLQYGVGATNYSPLTSSASGSLASFSAASMKAGSDPGSMKGGSNGYYAPPRNMLSPFGSFLEKDLVKPVKDSLPAYPPPNPSLANGYAFSESKFSAYSGKPNAFELDMKSRDIHSENLLQYRPHSNHFSPDSQSGKEKLQTTSVPFSDGNANPLPFSKAMDLSKSDLTDPKQRQPFPVNGEFSRGHMSPFPSPWYPFGPPGYPAPPYSYPDPRGLNLYSPVPAETAGTVTSRPSSASSKSSKSEVPIEKPKAKRARKEKAEGTGKKRTPKVSSEVPLERRRSSEKIERKKSTEDPAIKDLVDAKVQEIFAACREKTLGQTEMSGVGILPIKKEVDQAEVPASHFASANHVHPGQFSNSSNISAENSLTSSGNKMPMFPPPYSESIPTTLQYPQASSAGVQNNLYMPPTTAPCTVAPHHQPTEHLSHPGLLSRNITSVSLPQPAASVSNVSSSSSVLASSIPSSHGPAPGSQYSGTEPGSHVSSPHGLPPAQALLQASHSGLVAEGGVRVKTEPPGPDRTSPCCGECDHLGVQFSSQCKSKGLKHEHAVRHNGLFPNASSENLRPWSVSSESHPMASSVYGNERPRPASVSAIVDPAKGKDLEGKEVNSMYDFHSDSEESSTPLNFKKKSKKPKVPSNDLCYSSSVIGTKDPNVSQVDIQLPNKLSPCTSSAGSNTIASSVLQTESEIGTRDSVPHLESVLPWEKTSSSSAPTSSVQTSLGSASHEAMMKMQLPKFESTWGAKDGIPLPKNGLLSAPKPLLSTPKKSGKNTLPPFGSFRFGKEKTEPSSQASKADSKLEDDSGQLEDKMSAIAEQISNLQKMVTSSSASDDLNERLTNNRIIEVPKCGCLGPDYVYSEAVEGPYYTHLGAGRSVEACRTMLEERFGVTGKALRLEKIRYTGKEGKSSLGCPIAKWIIRRSGPDEKYLVVLRHRPGHFCETAWLAVVIVAWEGVPAPKADNLYDYLIDTLPKNGFETERRCGTNDSKTCACQGIDLVRRGASFSFGCSWSMYFNGCKFARSREARKFKLKDTSKESELESNLQDLAMCVAPLYKQVAPRAYSNQCHFEDRGKECRLGHVPGRPFSGVTACVDFCAHSHKDLHNMQNGSTVVVTLTKHRGFEKPDDEQLHVLPMYVMENTDESGSYDGQYEKIQNGSLEVLHHYALEARLRSHPLTPAKRKKGQGKKASPGKKRAASPVGGRSSPWGSSSSTSSTPKKGRGKKDNSFWQSQDSNQSLTDGQMSSQPGSMVNTPVKQEAQRKPGSNIPGSASANNQPSSYDDLMSFSSMSGFNGLYESFWDYFYTNGAFPPPSFLSSYAPLGGPNAGNPFPPHPATKTQQLSDSKPAAVTSPPSVTTTVGPQQSRDYPKPADIASDQSSFQASSMPTTAPPLSGMVDHTAQGMRASNTPTAAPPVSSIASQPAQGMRDASSTGQQDMAYSSPPVPGSMEPPGQPPFQAQSMVNCAGSPRQQGDPQQGQHAVSHCSDVAASLAPQPVVTVPTTAGTGPQVETSHSGMNGTQGSQSGVLNGLNGSTVSTTSVSVGSQPTSGYQPYSQPCGTSASNIVTSDHQTTNSNTSNSQGFPSHFNSYLTSAHHQGDPAKAAATKPGGPEVTSSPLDLLSEAVMIRSQSLESNHTNSSARPSPSPYWQPNTSAVNPGSHHPPVGVTPNFCDQPNEMKPHMFNPPVRVKSEFGHEPNMIKSEFNADPRAVKSEFNHALNGRPTSCPSNMFQMPGQGPEANGALFSQPMGKPDGGDDSVLDASVVKCEMQYNENAFMDPSMGGVAVALSHGAVLFEVAKRELHATTGLRNPNRYKPTRISLVFYQHKNLNHQEHGKYVYAKKMEDMKQKRIERMMAENDGKVDMEVIKNMFKGGKKKKKVEEEEEEVVDIMKTSAAQYKYMWECPARRADALSTDSIITRWIDPQPMVTGPFQKWV